MLLCEWSCTAHRREVLKREVEWRCDTAVTDGVKAERFSTLSLCHCCCIPRLWIMLGSDDGNAVDGVHGGSTRERRRRGERSG